MVESQSRELMVPMRARGQQRRDETRWMFGKMRRAGGRGRAKSCCCFKPASFQAVQRQAATPAMRPWGLLSSLPVRHLYHLPRATTYCCGLFKRRSLHRPVCST